MLTDALNLGQWENNSVIILKNECLGLTEAGSDHQLKNQKVFPGNYTMYQERRVCHHKWDTGGLMKIIII